MIVLVRQRSHLAKRDSQVFELLDRDRSNIAAETSGSGSEITSSSRRLCSTLAIWSCQSAPSPSLLALKNDLRSALLFMQETCKVSCHMLLARATDSEMPTEEKSGSVLMANIHFQFPSDGLAALIASQQVANPWFVNAD